MVEARPRPAAAPWVCHHSRVPARRITDASDPALEPFRDIRDRDAAGRLNVFIAEGRLVVGTLLTRSPLRTQAVFLTPNAYQSIAEALDASPDEPDVFIADRAVMEQVAGFDVHRGCLAVGARPSPPARADLLPPDDQPSTLLVLEGLSNHDNVGGLFRSALAFHADAVLLSPRCCDPLYRKAIRVSMAAALRVPFATADPWPDTLALLRSRGYHVVALTGSAPDRLLHDAARSWPDRVAFVLGAEGPGLSRQALAYADQRVRISIAAGVDSLNVVVAGSIALQRHHECRAQSNPH